MLCLSYYYLYSLFNKIRDKGRTQGREGEREGLGRGEEGGGGWEVGGRSCPNIVCTYE
jgi:hypothetical protein